MRPQNLLQLVMGWEARVDTIGIRESREARDNRWGTDGCIQEIPIGGVVHTQTGPGHVSKRERVVGLILQQRRAPPYASITHVRHLCHEIPRQLALHSKTPLHYARRPAGVPIDEDERRCGWTSARGRFEG